MTDNEYYQQTNSDKPLFGATYAKLMHAACPAAVYHQHPKLGGGERVEKAAFDFGTAFHAVLLDHRESLDNIVEIHADSYRTKAAQESRDAAYAEGKTPVLVAEMAKVRDMASAVHMQLADVFPDFYLPHEVEVPVDFSLYGITDTRSRIDLISETAGIIVDAKTTTNASTDACIKAIRQYGYDIQAAVYTEAANALYGEKDWQFFFLFAEKDAPWMINIIRSGKSLLDIGRIKAECAARLWESCLQFDEWPGYGVTVAEASSWEYDKYIIGGV